MAQDKYISLLEIRDRRPRIGTLGSEIVTTWYCEPASASPLVVCGLLGSITGNAATDTRVVPANDYEYPYMYCVEAHPAPMDHRSVSTGPSTTATPTGNDINDIQTSLANPAIFDGPLALGGLGQYQSPDNKSGLCGAYIEAIYRPLISFYNMPTNNPQKTDFSNQFDYVDAVFEPASRTVAVGDGLQLYGNIQAIGASALAVDTWQELTIRRIMCPSVPWKTIACLTERINGTEVWTPAHMTLPGLPNNTFPIGTLRFDGVTLTPRSLPSCTKNGNIITSAIGLPITTRQTWFDIVYKFSYRTTFAQYLDSNLTLNGFAVGQQGAITGQVQLNWNCDWSNVSHSSLLGEGVDHIHQLNPGWYESTTAIFQSDGTYKVRKKYLNAVDSTLPLTVPANTHPFDMLFLQGSP